MFQNKLSNYIFVKHEKVAFEDAVNGGSLNDAERKKLDRMTKEEEKDHYLGEITRTNYFRRCSWLSFLNGEKGYDKPFVEKLNFIK